MSPEVTVSAPVAVPLAVGSKMTAAVQLAPAARLVEHVFCERTNGALIASANVPTAYPLLLVIVTGTAVLARPTPTVENVTCAGLLPSPPGSCPAPFRATETAATPRVDEETARVAAMAPLADGVKTTWTVQLLSVARLVPQVVALME
jgi:hypothetical protein